MKSGISLQEQVNQDPASPISEGGPRGGEDARGSQFAADDKC